MENENYIARYLLGNATEEEKQQLLGWLEESEQNRIGFAETKAIWMSRKKEMPATGSAVKLARSINQMNVKIDREEMVRHRSLRIRKLKRTMIPAAAAIVAVAAMLVWQSVSRYPAVVYSNLTDTVMNISLPDGTDVLLNGNTTLALRKSFNKKERLVSLEGEAFFDVTKDTERPFTVVTNSVRIQVLGTSFNVLALKDSEISETLLEKGKIRLQTVGGNNLITLHPGQKATYIARKNDLQVEESLVSDFALIRYGLVSMKNASITEIVESIEKMYDVNITIDTTRIANEKYNFNYIKTAGLDHLLGVIGHMTGEEVVAGPR